MEYRIINKLTIFLVLMTLCKCSPTDSKENFTHKKCYWLDTKSRYPFGKIRIEENNSLDSVIISNSLIIHKEDFNSELKKTMNHDFPLVFKVNNIQFEIIEKVGVSDEKALVNLKLDSESGIVYSMETGVLMRYNSHDYEYLIMEVLFDNNGAFLERVFDFKYNQLSTLQYLPKRRW